MKLLMTWNEPARSMFVDYRMIEQGIAERRRIESEKRYIAEGIRRFGRAAVDIKPKQFTGEVRG